MRKNIFGRQLKRDTNERKALFKGLISHLVLNERIKTTEEKAKSIKGQVDKIITKAKKGKERARYLLQGQLPKEAIEKVILEITPRFSKRQGGYTRIIRIGRRFSDNAQMVLMEWTVNKSQISSIRQAQDKSQKLEPGAEVHEEKTPKDNKEKVETRIRKKDAKK